jgi:GH25 family lysozyme M1 (1,4-beta-N-acetylmuramidase)
MSGVRRAGKFRIVTMAGAALLLTAGTLPAVSAEAYAASGAAEGIDVATPQASLSFTAAASGGKGFAVVKEGGSQLSGGPYVSPHYTAQVDAARSAGLRVGHYWLSGDFQSPTAAADYFAANLHDYRSGDVVALDDEVLDDSTALWTDASVAAFFTEVKAKLGGVVPWFYISAASLRAHTWASTQATGAKLWVASWGANDGTRTDPDLGGAYPDWAVQQYTSRGSVGGVTTDLDYAKAGAFDPVGSGGGGGGGGTKLPKTTTQQDGVPGPVFWERCQHWLALTAGYTGPIDGAPGVNTYAALQRQMHNYGYTGPDDGVPGVNTYAALQRLAAKYGYTGPIDGVMGPNSWRGVATFLNQDAWD